jgi:DNA-binding MarR family transcriptional regulator
MAVSETTPSSPDDRWRQAHLGYLMGRALQRFDARVIALMAQDVNVPLALSNLAQRQQVGAAHIHITRHLPLAGARLTDLATSAGMSKQAMGKLVDQCEAWALVNRTPDARDARAKWVAFTPLGHVWLKAFEVAVAQASAELQQAVGEQVATVITIGLEAYVG